MNKEPAYGDLGFDIALHQEGLKAMASLGMNEACIKPALKARHTVLFEAPGTRFFAGVTSDPSAQEQAEAARGCICFAWLGKSASPQQAELIRSEIARYFLRHFPGRCLPQMSQPVGAGDCVFIACFKPTEE